MVERLICTEEVSGSNPLGSTMRLSTYLIYSLVFVGSFALVVASPATTSDTFRGFIAFPGTLALFGILFQLWRDKIKHDRENNLESKKQDFALGTASHMSNVAYDKHALFCEEYIARAQKGFQELLIEGPSKNASTIGSELVQIRIKHSAWLTKEIENKLKPFEQALITVGTNVRMLELLKGDEHPQRTKVVDEVFRFFSLILGENGSSKDNEAGIARDEVIEEIRNILGVNILTKLRQDTAELALNRLGNRH